VDIDLDGGVAAGIDLHGRHAAPAARPAYPEASLAFIIGGDSLRELHTWKDIYALLELAELVTVARPGFRTDDLNESTLRLRDPWPRRLAAQVASGHLVEISSTDIRQRVARGQSMRYLVPGPVEQYIADHALYRQQEMTR
jgi:nicotinate-nucleotide adenylyltransferase